MTGAPDSGEDSRRLFAKALAWLADGHGVALATVVTTWGSAPRRAGSHLIIRDDAVFQGSVSGGCVEGDVIVAAQDALQEGRAILCAYGVSDDVAWRVGLACGGKISVLIQPVSDAFIAPALLQSVLDANAQGQNIWTTTDLRSYQTVLHKDAPQAADGIFIRAYAPPLRLAIIGAVHIAQHLAPLAQQLGMDVRIIDPRGLFASDLRFDPALIDARWPDEALADFKPDGASAIVALTHDPKLDDVALAAALRSEAFYIAALGSRKNHALRVARLAALGFSETDTQRIYGPAGLAIGAATPAEIAVSILAQLIENWRARP